MGLVQILFTETRVELFSRMKQLGEYPKEARAQIVVVVVVEVERK